MAKPIHAFIISAAHEPLNDDVLSLIGLHRTIYIYRSPEVADRP
jgi:hypothetical protein